MHTILDYCTDGTRRHVTADTAIVLEGGNTEHLFVLIEGKLEVIRGDNVVAVLTEPGAVFGEMSILLNKPHSATVRAASDSVIYDFADATGFLRDQPAVMLLIAQLLAQRLNAATTYLADLMQQYSSDGSHLSMIGELLQTMINLPPTQISPGSNRKFDPRL